MSRLLLIFPVLVGFVVAWIFGGIESYFTAQIEAVPGQVTNCDELSTEEWTEACRNLEQNTKFAFSIFHVIGFFAGFGPALAFLKQLGLDD